VTAPVGPDPRPPGPDPGPIRVLMVDDQELVREGIIRLLRSVSDIDVVGQADDGEEAVEQVRSLRPDVVLMDVRMPRMGGVEATRTVLAETAARDAGEPRILMLTTYDVDEEIYAALRAGASGYVLKDAAPDELVAAVRAAAAGDGWLQPSVTRRLLADFVARPDYALPTDETFGRLTPRELEVLILAAYGFSNGEIARRLIIGQATVKTHIGRILMKLGARDRTEAVAFAYQSGLVQPGTPPPAP
jgi:DNA-binding NarL/FixJ family response regulator